MYDSDYKKEERKSLRWMRRLSHVPRWVVVPTLNTQSVAEHTFQVCALVDLLLPLHESGSNGEFRLLCLRQALYHDKKEAATGDSPSTSKSPKDYNLLAAKGQNHIVVKLADLLEAYLFIADEIRMGNYFHMHVILKWLEVEINSVTGHFKAKSGVDVTEVLHNIIATDNENTHPAIEAMLDASH